MYDKEVGYVQGMGFVAATALLYMGEEDTFWLLVALLKGDMHTPMEGLYQPVRLALAGGRVEADGHTHMPPSGVGGRLLGSHAPATSPCPRLASESREGDTTKLTEDL